MNIQNLIHRDFEFLAKTYTAICLRDDHNWSSPCTVWHLGHNPLLLQAIQLCLNRRSYGVRCRSGLMKLRGCLRVNTQPGFKFLAFSQAWIKNTLVPSRQFTDKITRRNIKRSFQLSLTTLSQLRPRIAGFPSTSATI